LGQDFKMTGCRPREVENFSVFGDTEIAAIGSGVSSLGTGEVKPRSRFPPNAPIRRRVRPCLGKVSFTMAPWYIGCAIHQKCLAIWPQLS
jgi:hypothetical protein